MEAHPVGVSVDYRTLEQELHKQQEQVPNRAPGAINVTSFMADRCENYLA
ncbi:MAG: hypothetical protein WC100_11325 [Sterolibacterium sp.]